MRSAGHVACDTGLRAGVCAAEQGEYGPFYAVPPMLKKSRWPPRTGQTRPPATKRATPDLWGCREKGSLMVKTPRRWRGATPRGQRPLSHAGSRPRWPERSPGGALAP